MNPGALFVIQIVMAVSYSLTILGFLLVFLRNLKEFLAEAMVFRDTPGAAKDEHVSEIQCQRSELEKSEERLLALVKETEELRTQRAVLEDLVAERTAILEQENRRQAALAEIELAINQPFELQPVLDKIVENTQKLLPASGGASITLLDAQTQAFDISASTVPPQASRPISFGLHPEDGATRWIVDHHKPLIVSDMSEHPFGAHSMLLEQGIQAYAGVPILIDAEVTGVLYALDCVPKKYGDGDIEFLTALAHRSGLAISKVRLFEQLKETNRLLAQRSDELDIRLSEVEKLNDALSNLLEDFQGANQILDTTGQRLAESNQELEAFTYSVSHDLRAPLRAVDGFSQILLEEYAAQIPEEAVSYLDKIREGARHMGELIGDLLDLSRLSRTPLRRSRIELSMVVGQALKELAVEQEDRNVEIKIGDLPKCQADPSLLKQVYINLISNALKFTRTRDNAIIAIGCQVHNGENACYVRDNGVGFDMAYVDKLFGVFQRLHPVEKFEGTGVGLVIVQRIIRRHGGRVWAEAEPDKGATFYFCLPKQEHP